MHSSQGTRRQRGVTLIETMIVVAVSAVVLGTAAPSFKQMSARHQVEGPAIELASNLLFARSEAISRGTTVTVSGNSTTDWKQGWTIRENGGGTVIRTQSARSARSSSRAWSTRPGTR